MVWVLKLYIGRLDRSIQK